MSISFNEIPVNVLTPGAYIEIDNSRAVQGTPTMPNIALIIAQKLTAGTVAEGVPALVSSGDGAEGQAGIGSHLAEMCRSFKKAKPEIELWMIPLDDAGGGVAQIRTITMGGTATEAGEIALYIGGRRISVSVASGDAAAIVSVAMDAAILAHADYTRMPYTSGQATVVVTLTARNKGVVTNGVDVRDSYQPTEKLPAGLTIAFAQTTPGSSDPTLSTAITSMGDVQYHTVVIPYTDATSLTAIEAEMLRRFGAMVKADGHVYSSAVGTQSTLTSLGNTRNSKHVTIISAGGIAGDSPTPMYEIASIGAAVDAAEPDPARPRQTLVLPGVLPQEKADQFTRTERNTLLTDGIATTVVDGGGLVRIERLVTTYQTNAVSAPDPSYMDVTTLRTVMLIRFDIDTWISLKFPRHKLADDGTLFAPGQAIVTPSSIRASLIALFRIWEFDKGIVEGGVQFKDDLLVVRDVTDQNRVNVRMSPDLMNQFRVFAGQVQYLL